MTLIRCVRGGGVDRPASYESTPTFMQKPPKPWGRSKFNTPHVMSY